MEQLYGTGASSRGLRVSTTYKSQNTLEAWSFLRFINLSREETTDQIERSSAHVYNDISSSITTPVSISNEIKCLKMLGGIMLAQLQRYDTSLEDDLKLLIADVLVKYYLKLYRLGWPLTYYDIEKNVASLLGGSFEDFMRK